MKTAQQHTTIVRTVHQWTTALYTDDNTLFAAIYGTLTPDVPDGSVELVVHDQTNYDENRDEVDSACAAMQEIVSETAENYEGLVSNTDGSVDIVEE